MAIENQPNTQVLTDDQQDVFQELINIAYGRAAGLLYDFMQEEIRLHIPEVYFCSYDEFVADVSQVSDSKMVISQQVFHGEIAGETLMVLSYSEAEKLSCLLNGMNEVTESDILSATSEVGNIITTASTQILSELMQNPIAFDRPITQLHSVDSLLNILHESDYSQIVLISTHLDIPSKNVKAKIYYLFFHSSIALLAKSLDYAS